MTLMKHKLINPTEKSLLGLSLFCSVYLLHTQHLNFPVPLLKHMYKIFQFFSSWIKVFFNLVTLWINKKTNISDVLGMDFWESILKRQHKTIPWLRDQKKTTLNRFGKII